jgi:hypothetical protein
VILNHIQHSKDLIEKGTFLVEVFRNGFLTTVDFQNFFDDNKVVMT